MSDDRGKIMLAIARATIASHLNRVAAADESALWLATPGACFVTLTIKGKLRGCIGSLLPYRPLLEDLKRNAFAAAFGDPRFAPLSGNELDAVRLEVSLLSPLTSIEFRDEADAVAQLRPGIDGVILEYGHNRGTFLPQVWEQLSSPQDFFRHLKMKAGLSPAFWADGIRLSRYTVEKWQENACGANPC